MKSGTSTSKRSKKRFTKEYEDTMEALYQRIVNTESSEESSSKDLSLIKSVKTISEPSKPRVEDYSTAPVPAPESPKEKTDFEEKLERALFDLDDYKNSYWRDKQEML